MDQVIIYTDGACSGNPGPGGYGIILRSGKHSKELSQGFNKTTNNRMELMGVAVALECLVRPCEVTVFSDSKYVVEAVEKGWAKRWRANGWRKADKMPAVNADLWGRLLDLMEKHRVRFKWVRGHASCVENNRCDELAVAASKAPGRVPDAGYEAAMKKAGAPSSLL